MTTSKMKKKYNICVLFGGVSPEHQVSLCSATSVLYHLDDNKYNILPVGITKEGLWYYFDNNDYSRIEKNTWCERSCFPCTISAAHGKGLIIFKDDGFESIQIDCIFPVLHGKNCEDGSIQGLAQVAGIPCVGPGVCSSAVSMDKSITKLIVSFIGVEQAKWIVVKKEEYKSAKEGVITNIESNINYPLIVKPAGTGSSVGVEKVINRKDLTKAIEKALEYDSKILVEEFVFGKEVEIGILVNKTTTASICGEVVPNAEFYDYETKYTKNTAKQYIPARITQSCSEKMRSMAVAIFEALGCKDLSRVDFFVSSEGERIIFNEINTLPGFTSISMYPKLFEASGIPYSDLLDIIIKAAICWED